MAETLDGHRPQLLHRLDREQFGRASTASIMPSVVRAGAPSALMEQHGDDHAGFALSRTEKPLDAEPGLRGSSHFGDVTTSAPTVPVDPHGKRAIWW